MRKKPTLAAAGVKGSDESYSCDLREHMIAVETAASRRARPNGSRWRELCSKSMQR